jgi:hypothetical protein
MNADESVAQVELRRLLRKKYLTPSRSSFGIAHSGRARYNADSVEAPQGNVMTNVQEEKRDHLFISYATEDIAVAEWLTYKLTTLGYRVWCDRIKLLGGESYPEDIDIAIKNRTSRFLALLSHASLNKANPRKERTIAHNIAKERQINFIIPLNLGLKPAELDWMMSDLTYVDFSCNWAQGLLDLLKALQKAGTPCSLAGGRDVVSDSVIAGDIVKREPEVIYSNLLKIKRIPTAVSVIRFIRSLDAQERKTLRGLWACRKIDNSRFLSFDMPPKDFPHDVQNAYQWERRDEIEGINARDVVSEILKKSLDCHCLARGLVWSSDLKWLYFPFDLTKNNRVSFVDVYGKNNSIQVCGERKFFTPGKPSMYRYYLAPTFKILRNMLGEDFIARLTLRIRVTDATGSDLLPTSSQARRKHVSRDWWNYEWVSRYLAVCSFLSNDEHEIVVGKQGHYSVVFSGMPLTYTSHMALDEKRIDQRQRDRKNMVLSNG